MLHHLFVILQQTNYNKYMKKLVFALLLIAVSSNVMDAAILSRSRIQVTNSKIWDTTTKSVSFIPIDASVEDIGLKENGEGLIGLSELVLETNFKQRIQDTHMGFTSNIELTEPFIEIVKVFVRNSSSGEKLYEIAPVLNTRQGDQIILSDGKSSQTSDAELKANSNYDTFMAKSKIITDEKSKYYQCEIKANSNKTLNPIIRIPFNINLPGLSESKMYKFKNLNTNIWYIYDPVKRYAYSFYDIDGFIPETYGMNSWINTVPEKSISMTTLSQFYKIIGL